jgi:hypothetical protein
VQRRTASATDQIRLTLWLILQIELALFILMSVLWP